MLVLYQNFSTYCETFKQNGVTLEGVFLWSLPLFHLKTAGRDPAIPLFWPWITYLQLNATKFTVVTNVRGHACFTVKYAPATQGVGHQRPKCFGPEHMSIWYAVSL